MISSLDLIHESRRIGVATIAEAQVEFTYDQDWAGDQDGFHVLICNTDAHAKTIRFCWARDEPQRLRRSTI